MPDTVTLRPRAIRSRTARPRRGPAPGRGRPPSPSPPVPPILADAREAARLCAVSEATWWRLHAARRTPVPIKIGHRTLWRIAEIREWVDAGRRARVWEAQRGAAQANGRPR